MATDLAKADPATAPYIPGDPVLVEHEGRWQRGVVLQRDSAERPLFGLRWALLVRLRGGKTIGVTCDDDGRNHTWRHQVMPDQDQP